MYTFYNASNPLPAPPRQTMRRLTVANQTIINVAAGATLQLTTLPPPAQGEPRSPRVSISTTCLDVASPRDVKPQPQRPKKRCGLC